MGPVDWVECVGEAAGGLEAVRRIDRDRPDLVFLDVKMPELSGLQVLQRIRHRPAVVFTTAYDRYAVTAFELEAVDYLLKPFSRKRFLERRVTGRLGRSHPHQHRRRRCDATSISVRTSTGRRGEALAPRTDPPGT